MSEFGREIKYNTHREGWICPSCKKSISPDIIFCPLCIDKEKSYTDSTKSLTSTTTSDTLPDDNVGNK